MAYVILGTCHGRVHVMLNDGTWSARADDESMWLRFDAATEARRKMLSDEGYADGYALEGFARGSLEKQARRDHGEPLTRLTVNRFTVSTIIHLHDIETGEILISVRSFISRDMERLCTEPAQGPRKGLNAARMD